MAAPSADVVEIRRLTTQYYSAFLELAMGMLVVYATMVEMQPTSKLLYAGSALVRPHDPHDFTSLVSDTVIARADLHSYIEDRPHLRGKTVGHLRSSVEVDAYGLPLLAPHLRSSAASEAWRTPSKVSTFHKVSRISRLSLM
jgi:hypothetical protein